MTRRPSFTATTTPLVLSNAVSSRNCTFWSSFALGSRNRSSVRVNRTANSWGTAIGLPNLIRFRWPAVAARVRQCLPAAVLTIQQDTLSPAARRILADARFLADDSQEGRGVGTAGLERAGSYIKEGFGRVGRMLFAATSQVTPW